METKHILYIGGAVVAIAGIYFIYDTRKAKAIIEGTGTGLASIIKKKNTTTAAASQDDSFPFLISKKSRGPNVEQFQKALNSLGAKLDPDGVFGKNTYTAWQNKFGQKVLLPAVSNCMKSMACPVTSDEFNKVINEAKTVNSFIPYPVTPKQTTPADSEPKKHGIPLIDWIFG